MIIIQAWQTGILRVNAALMTRLKWVFCRKCSWVVCKRLQAVWRVCVYWTMEWFVHPYGVFGRRCARGRDVCAPGECRWTTVHHSPPPRNARQLADFFCRESFYLPAGGLRWPAAPCLLTALLLLLMLLLGWWWWAERCADRRRLRHSLRIH